jgi:undecaprenyl-diphosphatase
MELTGTTFFFDWETALMVWLQAHMGGFAVTLASFFSMFGETLVSVAVLGFVYWCWDKEFGQFIGINVMVANTLNPMVKNIFLRRRTYFDYTEIKCLGHVDKAADIFDIAAQGYSFPSGHSSNSVTVFGSLAAYAKKRPITVAAVIIALGCGISRFCLGVHYPTDVLVGWLMGLAVVLLIPLLRAKIKSSALFYAILIIATLPGFFYCKSDDYFTSFGMLIGTFAGIEFEKKYVRFENTRKPLFCALRLIGGIAVYFGVSTVLKLPFGSEFLHSGTAAAHLVRAARYAVTMFCCVGAYPLIFKIEKKK